MTSLSRAAPGPHKTRKELIWGRNAVSFRFLALASGLTALAGILAGAFPVHLAIAIVFLFAGPHNWIELRYFLSKLPSRLGPLKTFFITAASGVAILAVSNAALVWLSHAGTHDLFIPYAIWNTVLISWVAALICIRTRQKNPPEWTFAIPLIMGVLAANWHSPYLFTIGLVYAHPLIGLCILDLELRRNPSWRKAFRQTLIIVPFILAAIWWHLSGTTLTNPDEVTWQITRHAGAGILSGVNAYALVATHAFLELLHYAVWIIAIPVATMGWRCFTLKGISPANRSRNWKLGLTGLLAFSALVVFVLWSYFIVDYPTTRTIYFAVAITHVLAEIPFLFRLI